MLSEQGYIYRNDDITNNISNIVTRVDMCEVYLKTCIQENAKLKQELTDINNKYDNLENDINIYKEFISWYFNQSIFKKILWKLKRYNINQIFNKYENI